MTYERKKRGPPWAERCSMPVEGPSDWANAAYHDGQCQRRWVEQIDGKGYCRQHADWVKKRSNT